MPISQWWHVVLVLLIVGVLGTFSVLVYRRDTHALPKPVAVTLLSLRLMALLGLLVFFAGPEKRSDARIVKPSRLAVLVDTSLSMGLADDPSGVRTRRRIDTVIDIVRATPLLKELNQQHELKIYRFGEADQPELVVESDKARAVTIESVGKPSRPDSEGGPIAFSRSAGWLGQVSVVIALLCLIATTVLGFASTPRGSWMMASGSLLLTTGVLVLAIADLLVSQIPLSETLGWRSPAKVGSGQTVEQDVGASGESVTEDWNANDWNEIFAPRGIATRLGSAVQQIVNNSRGSALAGIVLVTDGRGNQGTAPARAIASASDASIPVYVLGVGSNQPARNIRVSEIEAPKRVFPDDKFTLTAILQATGFQNETVRVRLSSADEDRPGEPVTEDEQSIQIPTDGEPASVKFELTQSVEGQRRYFVEVDSPIGDLDASDNIQSTVVKALLRKTRVLLIAGGPTRDYQFLRNQLFRDENVELDVWLQLARPGADQESDNLLFEFPSSVAELDKYDCLVGFDPDWRLLSNEQMRLLEKWVSEKAGGMLLIAGPVFTPEWTRRPRGEESIDLIRGLYPVSFFSQGSASLKLGRFGGKQPFPLEFSREGRTAKHLWLSGDDSAESIANWESFDGVFGYYAVNEPKAGAEVLSRFSDPATAIDGELPIYMASHYYGAGRVFFQASGEIWRLRSKNVLFFQNYYLNLIRWVSEGRLLRDSTRGVLLLDRNRCWVGDQISVRAILRDAADQPLMQKQVTATLRRPDGTSEKIPLLNIQDAARPGSFSGQFVAPGEGNYEVVLPLPFSPDSQSLTGSVHASIPDLEKMKPERNDSLLQQVADRTGGIYFYDLQSTGVARYQSVEDGVSTERETTLSGPGGLNEMIGVVDQETFLPGSPDETFTRKFSRWLLFWLVLVLCTEWIVRRLHKLA